MSDKYVITIKTEDPVKVVSGGLQGPPGISAYIEALNQGFVGSKEEWIDSLKGSSAYEVALNNGFIGTEQEWLDSLKIEIEVTPDDEYKVLSNNGESSSWYEIDEIMNNNNINWDLGEI